MPVSEPEQKPSDLFQAVGFSEVEVKSGTISRVLGISEEGFRSVAALRKKGSPLWQAAQEDRVTKHLIEIYSLDVKRSPNPSFPGVDGKQFSMIHFYNDTAQEIMNAISLELPPIISTIPRAKLPAGLGVGVRDYYFTILSTLNIWLALEVVRTPRRLEYPSLLRAFPHVRPNGVVRMTLNNDFGRFAAH
jgi:hypothetical protein